MDRAQDEPVVGEARPLPTSGSNIISYAYDTFLLSSFVFDTIFIGRGLSCTV